MKHKTEYKAPDFEDEKFRNSADVIFKPALKDKTLPDEFSTLRTKTGSTYKPLFAKVEYAFVSSSNVTSPEPKVNESP